MIFDIYVNIGLCSNLEIEAENIDEARDVARNMVKEDLVGMLDDYDIDYIDIETA